MEKKMKETVIKIISRIKKSVHRKKLNKIKRNSSEKIVYTVVWIFLALWAVLLLYPVFWLLLNSLKTVDQYYDNIFYAKPFEFPAEWAFFNYKDAFLNISLSGQIQANFFTMLFNSLWYCAIRVGMGVFVPLATAYAMAKYRFPGRELIYSVVIITMTLPIFGTNGAAFTFYYDLGLYNTPWYVIFTGLGGFGGAFLMMYGYFKSVSWSYAEAVYIDGGNDYTVFLRIMLPMAMPLMMTFGVMSFIGAWNDSGTMLIYLPDYPTLASGVFELSNGNDSLRFENPPAYFALLAIMALPVVIMFIVFSDKIMNNMSIGGIKG
jgi:raffinose/stachyose/melibiose transport system permease protein/N-acetylglucosamine transport system permease protein